MIWSDGINNFVQLNQVKGKSGEIWRRKAIGDSSEGPQKIQPVANWNGDLWCEPVGHFLFPACWAVPLVSQSKGCSDVNKIKIVAVSTTLAVAMTGTGVVFAAKAGAFESPKQLLQNQIGNFIVQSLNKRPQSGDVTISARLIQLSARGTAHDPTTRYLVKLLNGAALSTDIAFDPQHQLAKMGLTMKSAAASSSANIWMNHNDVVLDASSFQSLMDQAVYQMQPGSHSTVTGKVYGQSGGSKTPKIPKYLYTGPKYAKQVQQFWAQLDKTLSSQASHFTPQQIKAIKDVDSWVIESIPSNEITRVGLNRIQISFTEVQLKAIVQTFVGIAYHHKKQFSNDWSVLTKQDPTLRNIFSLPEARAMKQVDTLFNNKSFSLDRTTITLSTNLSGAGQASFSTGFYVNDTQDGVKAHVALGVSAHTPNNESIKMPTFTPKDSQTFDKFAATFR